MNHSIKVTPVPRKQPDLDQFVAALLAMAMARLAEEKAEQRAAAKSEEAE
jgi:hypothetical protein